MRSRNRPPLFRARSKLSSADSARGRDAAGRSGSGQKRKTGVMRRFFTPSARWTTADGPTSALAFLPHDPSPRNPGRHRRRRPPAGEAGSAPPGIWSRSRAVRCCGAGQAASPGSPRSSWPSSSRLPARARSGAGSRRRSIRCIPTRSGARGPPRWRAPACRRQRSAPTRRSPRRPTARASTATPSPTCRPMTPIARSPPCTASGRGPPTSICCSVSAMPMRGRPAISRSRKRCAWRSTSRRGRPPRRWDRSPNHGVRCAGWRPA